MACRDCPFKLGSRIAYDRDAMDALTAGYTPSCHMVVGMDAIFNDPFPSEKVACRGHEEWQDGRSGFGLPKLIQEE